MPDSDEDDGYLLTGTNKGGFQRVVVFPGPAMLKTMLYLVAARKMTGPTKSRGKVVLSDLELHFAEYGVDFASSVGARPQLISELSRLGSQIKEGVQTVVSVWICIAKSIANIIEVRVI